MKTTLPALCEQLRLRADGRVPVVNSRDVAVEFEKRHDNVLRDVDELLLVSSDLRASDWFRQSTYLDVQNREQRSFDLTRDGFTLLVQGWTGPKALDFKIRYIEAFNAMEELLRTRPEITSHAEFLEAIRELVRPLAIRFDAQDTAINRVEGKVDALDQKVDKKFLALDNRMNRRHKAKAKKHEPILIYVVQHFFGGRCPVSGLQILTESGERIPGASALEHYYETSRGDIGNFWLVATHINTGLESGTIPRDTLEPHFKAFQEKLRSITGAVVRFPKQKEVKQLHQPSLF